MCVCLVCVGGGGGCCFVCVCVRLRFLGGVGVRLFACFHIYIYNSLSEARMDQF